MSTSFFYISLKSYIIGSVVLLGNYKFGKIWINPQKGSQLRSTRCYNQMKVEEVPQMYSRFSKDNLIIPFYNQTSSTQLLPRYVVNLESLSKSYSKLFSENCFSKKCFGIFLKIWLFFLSSSLILSFYHTRDSGLMDIQSVPFIG